MKKIILVLVFLLATPFYASAVSIGNHFTFSGTDENGVGSAEMEVDVSLDGKTLIVKLDNTSPITTTTGDVNAPGIDGFGFFFDQDDSNDGTLPGVDDWTLTAYDGISVNPVIIGSKTDADLITPLLPWSLEYEPDNVIGIKYLDYFYTNVGGVSEALYNPTASVAAAANDPYFTEAILTIIFEDSVEFVDGSGAYVRMQNVGDGGEGSLKLFDYWTDENGGGGGGDPIPEPSTLILLGAGIVGLVAYRRKRS